MSTSTQSIREIISRHTSAAGVLQRFDIDLCDHADNSLQRACADLQLSIDQVLERLSDAAANENGVVPADLASYSLTRLVQHIVRTHHQYVRRELPRLAEMAHKLAGKHGGRAPELKKLEQLLLNLHTELLAHLQKEELILFPFIAQMDQDVTRFASLECGCFQTVAQPVSIMIAEHGSVENLMAEVRALTNEFTVPAWACPTHTSLYAGLSQFDRDLRQHVHLENDILFARAIEMESALGHGR